MRKSALEKQIGIVIEKNNELFSKCNELQHKLSEKENIIQELERVIEGINAEKQVLFNELSEIKANALSCSVEEDAHEDVIPQNSDNESNVEPWVDNQSKTTSESITNITNDKIQETQSIEEIQINNISNLKSTLLSNNKLDSASAVIGRVVLRCSEVCNTFVSVGDINSKDLVNLALGRTEVFKSEVLALATSNDISIDMFNAELRLKETAVIEYFDLLLKQI